LQSQPGTRFSRSGELASKSFQGQGFSAWFQVRRPFLCRVVGHDTSVQGCGGHQQRTVGEVWCGRIEAHRKPSQVGNDQLL